MGGDVVRGWVGWSGRIAAVLFAAVASFGCGAPVPAPAATATDGAAEVPEPEPTTLSIADIAERATPSVVSIRSGNSLGSGFVVRDDGWIATNLHVIVDAAELEVVTADGSEFSVVEVLALDFKRDLALIRIDKTGLPEVSFGDSEGVRPGDPVVAIGHPLGLEDTVSNGLISAVREVDPTLTLLQISAPIAPGSSGGPLIDHHGSVIGIATAISTEGQNLNFGVPTRYLKELMGNVDPVSWSEFVAMRNTPALPAVKRDIPHHHVNMLTGCGEGDLKLLFVMMGEAIEVGAPLFNGGNFAACYHVYDGAASDAERKLGSGCAGPKRALVRGRTKAASLADPAAQAWAMRDAFDGLLDVIHRKLDPP
jgi:serine protease Do